MAHTAPTHQASSNHSRLQGWVEEVAALTQPDDIYWCDGSDEEYEQLRADADRRRHVREALRRQAPGLVPGAVGSRRCGAGRGPHVHLLRERGGRRADQQLARPGRDAPGPHRAVRGLDARPDDVRRAVLDGPDRLADLLHRRPADRLGVRGRVDADHDPHGAGGARRARRGRRVRALPALGRRAARRRRAGRAVAVQRRQQVHRPLPRDAGDLVVRLGLRRQRAARQEVLRAADRLGRWRATRAGSPSTC